MGSVIAAWGQAVQSVVRRWDKLYCVSLVLHILYYCYYYFFRYCLITLSLSQSTSFTFHPFSSPSRCGGGRSEWAAAWSSLPAAGLKHGVTILCGPCFLAVHSVMCQKDMSLRWNDVKLCWIPCLLIVAGSHTGMSAQVLRPDPHQNWVSAGTYTRSLFSTAIVSLSPLLPNLAAFTFQLHFFTWLLRTKSFRKFQVQPQPKIFLSWLMQTAQRISCHSGTISK